MPRRQVLETPRGRRGPQPAAVNLARKLAGKPEPGEGTQETQGRNQFLTRSGAWRFRRHTAPFALLAALITTAAVLHATTSPVLWGILAGFVIPGLLSAAARVKGPDKEYKFSRYARGSADTAAVYTGIWLPLLAAAGLRPYMAWLLVTWAPLAGLWVRHYRWRPAPPEEQPKAPADDLVTWEKLADKRKWAGVLENPQGIPGGRKWDIRLDGTQTHIGQIMAEPRAIAAAWDKPQTEAYAEPDQTGIESRGVLTILQGGTLETVSEWDGEGFCENGIARIGRFADSMAARIRCVVPMDGTKHGLVAGTSGAGKSELLNLLIWLALASPLPIVPVILDPQNGQSLPQWRGKVLYAAGIEECARMVRGLHAGMMDRSLRLADMAWDDDGHTVRGMEFFDARLSGLPIVMPIMDEAPLLLAGGGNARLSAEMMRLESESAKLARKTGKSKWVVAQVPSLGEMGDQAYRAMLRGGTVVCLRTGEKVSAGMLGLTVDPSSLPQYFTSGEPTQGLGYVVSVDGRQAPFRSDLVPRAKRHQPVEVPSLEPEFLESMDKAMGGISPTASFPPPVPSPAPRPAPQPAPQPEPDGPEPPEGRRCADAVWMVLSERGTPMDRGQIIQWVNELATGAWGREKPFTIRAITTALSDLVEGKIPGRTATKPNGDKGGVYQAVTTQQERTEEHEGNAQQERTEEHEGNA